MPRTPIHAPSAPAAIGPYSHGAHANGTLSLSGQTPIDPATGELVAGGVADQTRQVFDNLRAVLTAAGLDFDDVLKVNVYLTSMDDFQEMNAVYADTFTAPFPARTTVAVAGLPLGARIEIECTAALPA